MGRQESGARIATVVFPRGCDVDAVLAAAVGDMRRRGLRVAGLLQHVGETLPSGKRSMWIEDIASGRRRRIDEPRGPAVTGCTLDRDALAAIACELREALRARPALLVVNRFGCSEASGAGLRAEIAEAVCAGTPLLIAVRDDLLPAWEAFLGLTPEVLPPELAALRAWIEAMPRASAAAA